MRLGRTFWWVLVGVTTSCVWAACGTQAAVFEVANSAQNGVSGAYTVVSRAYAGGPVRAEEQTPAGWWPTVRVMSDEEPHVAADGRDLGLASVRVVFGFSRAL